MEMSSRISFNMSNAEIPMSFTSFDKEKLGKLYNEVIDDLSKGYYISQFYILNLKIGKKYYMYYNNTLNAFKVLSANFLGQIVTFDIQYPNGKIDYINPNEFKFIFSSKEDFYNFREKEDMGFCFSEKIGTIDYINQFCESSKIKMVRFKVPFRNTYHNIDYRAEIYPRIYKLDEYAKSYLCNDISLKYLWVDINGIHFVVDSKDESNIFLTKEDCDNSLEIRDFFD